ncbi:glycerate kinase [Akkermansiaceae bacterium]|nr:glycerate kinase [Akkermansiaceae bacterium]MDB4544387.1 glycerate kinase [Akkermansiaceae bacterium]
MRVLIANDKFKGSLTATEAAEAIAAGLPASCEIDICPIADGGEGFTETMLSALGGKWMSVETVDALYRPVTARYVITDSGLAVMEMASASGYELINESDRNILQSSTYGTGLMMKHAAAQSETERILIGIGGSATNDGGVGMADALGVLFLDSEEDSLPALPCSLGELDSIDLDQLTKLPPVDVACDVDNPLLGPRGATAIFGPQKGATEEEQKLLEEFLTKLVRVSKADEIANRPGAGAAGGLGFGLMHFTDAELHPGFDLVAQALDLEGRIAAADLVITGEGSLDAQSLLGKGPVGVARMAKDLGKPVIGLAGHISTEVLESDLFTEYGSLSDFEFPLEELMSRASELLTEKVRELRDLIPLI